jgi:hypothetical protein
MMVKVRSKHIMASAKGKPCTFRIASLFPGYSCASEETTLLCHLDNVGGKGTSTKVTDLGGCYSCKHCDDIFTGLDWKRLEYIQEKYPLVLGQRVYSSLVETHAMLVDEGLLVVPGSRVIR